MSNNIEETTKEAVPVATAAVAIPVASPAAMAMRDQEKQGAKCCFCCCDYRRAVVAISVIFIVVYIINIILVATGSAATFVTRNVNDNLTQEQKDDLDELGTVGIISIVVYVIFFFCNIWALCAALKYSVCMLSTMVVVILIQFGFYVYQTWAVFTEQADQAGIDFNNVSFIVTIVIAAICWGLYLYPVIGLISEIKSEIMSQVTYPREDYSCCCNPKNTNTNTITNTITNTNMPYIV